MPEFFETGMGRKYYEGTLPRMARALERIADALERGQDRGRTVESAALVALEATATELHIAVTDGTRRLFEQLRAAVDADRKARREGDQ